MKVIICPGVHEPQLTDRFTNALAGTKAKQITKNDWLAFPTNKNHAYSPFHLYDWLNKPEILNNELFFIAFSAGVVGAIGAAVLLQLQGVKIAGFIAVDGWGVPLWVTFPTYRLSHDYFTHWSSAILGTGRWSFYCEPFVEHLTLWSSPEICQGWVVERKKDGREIYRQRITARDYLQAILSGAIFSTPDKIFND
jgi:hypothetical protein